MFSEEPEGGEGTKTGKAMRQSASTKGKERNKIPGKKD